MLKAQAVRRRESATWLADNFERVPLIMVPCSPGKIDGATLGAKGRVLGILLARGVELHAGAAQPGPRLGMGDDEPRATRGRTGDREVLGIPFEHTPRPACSRSATRWAPTSTGPDAPGRRAGPLEPLVERPGPISDDRRPPAPLHLVGSTDVAVSRLSLGGTPFGDMYAPVPDEVCGGNGARGLRRRGPVLRHGAAVRRRKV